MRRPAIIAAAVGALGAVGWIVALVVDPTRALLGWLAAYVFGVTIVVGALLLIVLTDLAEASWFLVFRPTAAAIAATTPIFALLFVPVLAGMRALYPWAAPASRIDPAALEEVHHTQRWLTPAGFVARALLYLAVWSALAIIARTPLRGARRPLAAGGILALAFTLSAAAFEWIMSLEIGWSSTIFGMYVCVAAFLAGTSAVAVAAWAAPPAGAAPDHVHALGRLMLVGVALWAYLAYWQLALQWIAHLPAEVRFYVERASGAWRFVNVALVALHFVVPFLALLSRELKRRRDTLAAIAGLLLATHAVDAEWLVVPSRASAPSLADVAALVAIAGIAAAVALRRPAAPAETTPLPGALEYHSP